MTGDKETKQKKKEPSVEKDSFREHFQTKVMQTCVFLIENNKYALLVIY